MSSRTLRLVVGLALALGSFAFSGGDTVTQADQTRKPRIRMLTPRKGDVFKPGDHVTITWEFTTRDGQLPGDPAWCEQEIFLSLDGGRTNDRRITRALGSDVRSYEWIVPNTPTSNAVLDIHYGCETTDAASEVPNRQIQAQFQILAPNHVPGELKLNQLPTSVRAGDSLSVGWTSTVADAGPYVVSVSYDHGGEFVELGSTNATALSWTVPAQYVGSLTFRVATTTRDGQVFESSVTAGATTTVRRQ